MRYCKPAPAAPIIPKTEIFREKHVTIFFFGVSTNVETRQFPSSYMNVWASRLASSSQCLRGTGLLMAESSAKAFAHIRCGSSSTNPSLHDSKKPEIPSFSPKQRRKQRKKAFPNNISPSTPRNLPTAVNYDSSSFHSSVKGKKKLPAKVVLGAPQLPNWKHHPPSRSLSPAIVKTKVRKRKFKRKSSSVTTAGDLIHFARQTGEYAKSGPFPQMHLRQRHQRTILD